MTETEVAENPLLAGLGPRRTPEPCAMVIFGASGDLTQRKIFPALYALAYRRLLPERFAIVGAARSDVNDDEFRDRMENAVREFGRDDFKQEVWDWLAEATHYLLDGLRRRVARGPARRAPEPSSTRSAAPAATASTTSPSRRPRCRRSSRSSASAERPKAGRGSSSRSRSATTSTSARELHEPDQPPLHRGRGLPDRPLPRQGDRPEHARAPLRERHLRADLEPPVHRPRPDHRRRDAGHRGARRLLRDRPARSATSSRTTCSSSSR